MLNVQYPKFPAASKAVYFTVNDVYVFMVNLGWRLDSTLTTSTLSVNVGGVHVMFFCSELVRSVMLEGQFLTEGGVTSR